MYHLLKHYFSDFESVNKVIKPDLSETKSLVVINKIKVNITLSFLKT